MNTLFVLMIVIIVVWVGIYTISYGVWIIKQKNNAGGIALIILSIACVALPLYLLWIRR